MGGAAPLVFNQTAFRGRDDTADSNEDAGWLYALNTNWEQVTDTPFRIRFNAQREARISSNSTYMGLYYSQNGGAWTYLDNAAEAFTTDSIMHCIESANVAGYVEGTDTTYLLGSSDPLLANNNGIVESGGDSNAATWPIDAGALAADFEWCLTLRSSLVSIRDTIGIRMWYSDAEFAGTYTQDLTITVATASNTGTILKIQGGTAAIKGATLAIK